MKNKQFIACTLLAALCISACGQKEVNQTTATDSSTQLTQNADTTPTREQEQEPAAVPSPANTEEKQATAETAPEAPMRGPQIELRIMEVDGASSLTKVELINRMDEAIVSISGKIELLDAEGKPMTYANGTPITSPFQQVKNPYIVAPKSSVTITLGNKLKAGVSRVSISDKKAKTATGKTVDF
jgi:hypothetical protein